MHQHAHSLKYTRPHTILYVQFMYTFPKKRQEKESKENRKKNDKYKWDENNNKK